MLSRLREIARRQRLAFAPVPEVQQGETMPTVVSFTGGTGAQILSLAIVADLRSRGEACGVDLSYFDRAARRAAPGEGVSTWAWGLDYLGFSRESVASMSTLTQSNGRTLRDSPEKLRLALDALSRSSISAMFPNQSSEKTFENLGVKTRRKDFRYAAFHLRRGDYLNVASHVVPDSAYVSAAKRVSTIVSCAVVVSDSEVPRSLVEKFQTLFTEIIILDDPDSSPGDLHHLLRNATIHIGSNGQFSLTAGLLSRGLFLLPKPFMPSLAEAEKQLSRLTHFASVD